MTDIFAHSDFREYLKEYYKEKKRSNPHFSYQLLAQKAGFRNREFLFSIIKGTKRLSTWRILKLSNALGHGKKERDYFVNLVHSTQAEDEDEREYFRMQMLKNKSDSLTKTDQIKINQYEFYSTWYHTAVRSIISMHRFKDDYEGLGRRLSPPITGTQAKSSIHLLESLGLICRDEKDHYRITGQSIRPGPEISEVCKKRFHSECIKLARRAIDEGYPDNCNAISLTLGMSRRTYEYIMEETAKFKNKILELANNDDDADRVYQYQFVSFPLTGDEQPDIRCVQERRGAGSI